MNNVQKVSAAQSPHSNVLPARNPFQDKMMQNELREPRIRSLAIAMKRAVEIVNGEKPAVVVFANSSGYPLYKIYTKLALREECNDPPALLLPLSSHHFLTQDKREVLGMFREIRENTFRHGAGEIEMGIGRSTNPNGPIYIMDEVLSGSCVVGIRNALSRFLQERGAGNEIRVIGISSQRHMRFVGYRPGEDLSKVAYGYAERGLAYIRQEMGGGAALQPTDFQITFEGLRVMMEEGSATFKNVGFRRLVNRGIAHAIPVIDLFTTDNLDFNPLLALNRKGMRLESSAESYSTRVIENVSGLSNQIAHIGKLL